jgi:hypothetical protein
MNAFDLLNVDEKRVLSHMLKGLTLAQMADIYSCTIDEVNNVGLQMIAKFDQPSMFKSFETSCFQI